MKNRFAAFALLLLLTAPLAAQDEPKPPIDKPPVAPKSEDPSKEKEKEKPKWDVANPPYPYDVDVSLDVTSGTVDVSRRLARRRGDRLRSPGRLYTIPIAGAVICAA